MLINILYIGHVIFSIMTLINMRFNLFILLIVVIQSLIAFQGFDVCDEGFSLTFYQQIFENPKSVEYNFAYWLSGLVGGTWYLLYNEGGIIWFRFLAVIFNTATFIIAYKLLIKHISRRNTLIGLTMVLFVNSFGYLAFYHNHLTAFLTISSIYFLYKGISINKFIAIAISGFLVGINVFTRLPNITLLVFIFSFPIIVYWRKENLVKAIKPIIIFTIGVLLGLVSILGIMYCFGHLEIMQKSLLSIIELGGNDGSTHNVFKLFHSYIYNYKKVLFLFFIFLLISVFVLYNKSIFKTNRYLRFIKYIIGFFAFAFLFKKGNIHIIYALGYIGVIGVLVTKQNKMIIKILALLGLLMMMFLPLGSAGGIYDSGYVCVWISIPMFIHFLNEIEVISFKLKTKASNVLMRTSQIMMKSLISIIFLSYFVAKGYSISQEAYFDPGSRIKKSYKINSSLANGVYTTKERAQVVNDLLFVLKDYVSKGDCLLVYESMPMIHFLTQTQPYMYNPWVWIYDGYSFENKIRKAEKEISILPIVLQQKFQTIGEFSEPMINYLDETKENNFLYNNKRMIEMNSFLERNKYEIVWSNSHFNIYKANKR